MYDFFKLKRKNYQGKHNGHDLSILCGGATSIFDGILSLTAPTWAQELRSPIDHSIELKWYFYVKKCLLQVYLSQLEVEDGLVERVKTEEKEKLQVIFFSVLDFSLYFSLDKDEGKEKFWGKGKTRSDVYQS